MRSGIWLSTLVALGCGASQPQGDPIGDPDPRDEPPAVAEPAAEAAAGVALMAPSCTEGVDERCDAVDQDCDGLIDEGCGYETGALQITTAWNTDADVDLVITGPGGAVASSDAGQLDRVAAGACGEPTRARIENARWAEPPPSGVYRVALRHASDCEREGAETTATVSVSALGRVLGVYNTAVAAGATVPVAEVVLP